MRSLPSLLTILVAALSLTSCLVIDSFTGENINAPIRENGIPASAEILEIWETGTRLNDNPVVGFLLLVTLEDGTSYEAETRNVVSIVHLCQVQPGAVVAVKVDPQDRSRVALEVERSGPSRERGRAGS